LAENDVASKRESPFSLHYKLFAGTHVPDIVMRSGKEIASSTSKEGIIEELKAMSKTLEETIRTSTERKICVDKMIVVLSNQKEVEEMVEGNNNAIGNKDEEAHGNTEDGSTADIDGNTDDEGGNDD
jgi:hypothetical protein